jgi:hypothetical protein
MWISISLLKGGSFYFVLHKRMSHHANFGQSLKEMTHGFHKMRQRKDPNMRDGPGFLPASR